MTKDTIKQLLAESILTDSKKMQIKGYEHPVGFYGQPNLKRFGYKEYKGNVYAILEANDSQTQAYYINGDIVVTHHGQDRSKVMPRLKGNWTFIFER